MKVIHKHNIYLDKRQSNIYIDVMQADAYTRILEFTLYSGGKAWNVPSGVDVAVAYSGPSGKGIYDTLPGGADACTVSGNVVSAIVVPQALAMHGNVQLTVVFTNAGGKQLAAFCVTLKVEANPAVNATRPPDYINLRQWMSEELISQITQATARAETSAQTAEDAAKRAEAAGKTLTVHVSRLGDGFIADKTYAELYAAYEAGQTVVCKLSGGDELGLVQVFSGLMFQSVRGQTYQIVFITRSDTVTYETGQYALSDELGDLETAVDAAMQTAEDAEQRAEYAVEASKTYYVYIASSGDGYSLSSGHITDIVAACYSGRAVVCYATAISNQGSLIFPLVRYSNTTVIFSGVYDGKEYLVTITTDGVTVDISEVGGAGLSITDDGNGNVTISATGAVKITDDGDGNVTIA